MTCKNPELMPRFKVNDICVQRFMQSQKTTEHAYFLISNNMAGAELGKTRTVVVAVKGSQKGYSLLYCL